MAELDHFKGVQAVVRKLKFKAKQYESVSILVGYSANYALGVHENIEMKGKGKPRRAPSTGLYWDPQGQAQSKFLEAPAREKQREILSIVRDITKATGSLEQGLTIAGLFLQRTSQELVPVDQGPLKASAFTRKENRPNLTMHS